METLGSIVVYAGLLVSIIGSVSLIKPVKFMGIASRATGLLVLATGILVVLVAFVLPVRLSRITTPETKLDYFAPEYEFQEFHSIRVKAPRERVWKAIKEVRANEIPLFRTLTWIRRFGHGGGESILNPSNDVAILESAARTSFLLLSEEAEKEIVLGNVMAAPRGVRWKKNPTPDDYHALQGQGFVLAMINFRVQDAVPGECIVTTETRVHATDSSVRRRFAPYWRTIYPGSALIRVMWLRAIRHRAEKMPG